MKTIQFYSLSSKTNKKVLSFICNIHQEIICAAENDKKTEETLEGPVGKTPGQRLKSKVVSSLILKKKDWDNPLGQKGPQNFPTEEANSGLKLCNQPVKWL